MSTLTQHFVHPTLSTVPLMRPIAPSGAARVLEVALLLDQARADLDALTDDFDRAPDMAFVYVIFLNLESALMNRIEILEHRHRLALDEFAIEMSAIANQVRGGISQTPKVGVGAMGTSANETGGTKWGEQTHVRASLRSF